MNSVPGEPEAGDWESFRLRVYAVVQSIPVGRVCTYGTIALALGYPRRARHVGRVLATLPADLEVPAHRVVNHAGVLSGAHAFGEPGHMRELLTQEGVAFLDDGRVNMRRHLWEPPA